MKIGKGARKQEKERDGARSIERGRGWESKRMCKSANMCTMYIYLYSYTIYMWVDECTLDVFARRA